MDVLISELRKASRFFFYLWDEWMVEVLYLNERGYWTLTLFHMLFRRQTKVRLPKNSLWHDKTSTKKNKHWYPPVSFVACIRPISLGSDDIFIFEINQKTNLQSKVILWFVYLNTKSMGARQFIQKKIQMLH